jgi:hypothetical protein
VRSAAGLAEQRQADESHLFLEQAKLEYPAKEVGESGTHSGLPSLRGPCFEIAGVRVRQEQDDVVLPDFLDLSEKPKNPGVKVLWIK